LEAIQLKISIQHLYTLFAHHAPDWGDTAVKRFKSWGKAVKTAGIDYESFLLRKRMSKAEIKRQILKLHNEKVDLAYPNMREDYSNLLAAGMKKVGNGSWALGRKKCGIRINYRLPKHKRKIKAHV
jgi:hypothetical protein